jgi:hypothetical protein
MKVDGGQIINTLLLALVAACVLLMGIEFLRPKTAPDAAPATAQTETPAPPPAAKPAPPPARPSFPAGDHNAG